jgi:hypothetical protein
VALFVNYGNKVFILGTVNLHVRDEISQLCFNKNTILSEMGIESIFETSCLVCMLQTMDSVQHNCDVTSGTRIDF